MVINMKVVFVDINNNEIESYGILDCPVKEEIILNKSIELFNENDPCIIYKSYARKKILLEFEHTINQIYFSNNIIETAVITEEKMINIFDVNKTSKITILK